MEKQSYEIRILGTVQGVGFRPFVYQLAVNMGLQGTVRNGAQGVEIHINASSEELQNFLETLQGELPPLATISHLETRQIPQQYFTDFCILSSDDTGEHTAGIPPDIAVCSSCEAELFDPANRRYGYPFITCTDCGVRYSIIDTLPYDRPNTSMRFFVMCDTCRSEYTNPMDRRYHAQPIGCWECGPKLSLWAKGEKVEVKSRGEVERAAQLLLQGKIVAVKGVGGYHLMCDATNKEAIARLRERKHRPAKPLAVMVRDIDAAEVFSDISEAERKLLLSRERPIVLCRAKAQSLPAVIAPHLSHVGIFLPYTPLHLLLLEAVERPLVATSANITDEPICTDRASLGKLDGVYDYLLDHDREILNGVDDSVVMVVEGRQIMLRRARGYAPVSIQLPFKLTKSVLALGANQKSTIAIGFGDQVILSPHIGDLDSIDSVEYYKKNITTLERIYDFKPQVIVHDSHPNYESTKVAQQFKSQMPKAVIQDVQHHYAHILSVMAEKKMKGKVFGVAFDGTGLGDDGKLWGGEFMLCDYRAYTRIAHVDYFKLLGGDKAIKEPRRVALSLLFDLYGEEALQMKIPSTQAFTQSELRSYFVAWKKGLNAPESSSVGRVFDAVASLLGISQVMHFEGESGMLLEEQYCEKIKGHYPFGYEDGIVNILPMIQALLGESKPEVAATRFFHTLVEIIATVYDPYQDFPLVVSGGVFQNRILLSLLFARFPEMLVSSLCPPNDGGIALGQSVAYR